jgi:hypothetical protein
MKPCDFCGNPQATPVDDLAICDACYIARSSCCADWPDDTVPPACPEAPSPPPLP